MATNVAEVAEGVFRLTSHVAPMDFTFCQYLVVGDESLLFHTGPLQLADDTIDAIERTIGLDALRWVSWGHAENDECGAIERILAAAPRVEPAVGAVGTMLWMGELHGRPIRTLEDDEGIDLGGTTVRWIDTPQVPHGWDAGLLLDERSGALFCGDLFTVMGSHPDQTDDDLVEAAMALEYQMPGGTALTPHLARAIRALGDREPALLAPMHAPTTTTDCAGALTRLGDEYQERFQRALAG